MGVTDVSHTVLSTVVLARAFGAKVHHPAQETSGKSARFVFPLLFFQNRWKLLTPGLSFCKAHQSNSDIYSRISSSLSILG